MSSFKDDMSNLDAVAWYDYYISSENRWLGEAGEDFESYENTTILTQSSIFAGFSSTRYLWFGKVGATIKSSRGRDVGTYFYLYSSVFDLISFDFDGSDVNSVQTSLQVLDGPVDRKKVTVHDTFDDWHYYEFDWSEDKLVWSVDGKVARTLLRKDTWNETSKQYDFPSNPAVIAFEMDPVSVWNLAIGTSNKAYDDSYTETDDYVEYGYNYAFIKNVSVEAYGLPSFVKVEDESKYNAFTYNSTSGDRTAVVLTNETIDDFGYSDLYSDSFTSSLGPFSMSKLTTLSDYERASTTTSSRSTEAGSITSAEDSESETGGTASEGSHTDSSSTSSGSGERAMSQPRFLQSLAELLLVGVMMF